MIRFLQVQDLSSAPLVEFLSTAKREERIRACKSLQTHRIYLLFKEDNLHPKLAVHFALH
jgi:hypothetical protein